MHELLPLCYQRDDSHDSTYAVFEDLRCIDKEISIPKRCGILPQDGHFKRFDESHEAPVATCVGGVF